jgi:hypothetical protein
MRVVLLLCVLLTLVRAGSFRSDAAWRAWSIRDSNTQLHTWPNVSAAHSGTAQLRSDVVDVDTLSGSMTLLNVAIGRGSLHFFHLADSARDVVKLHLHAFNQNRASKCGHSLKYSILLHNDSDARAAVAHCGALSERLALILGDLFADNAAVMLGEFVFPLYYTARTLLANVPRADRRLVRFCEPAFQSNVGGDSPRQLTEALVTELVADFTSTTIQSLLESDDLTCFRRLRWGHGPRLFQQQQHDDAAAHMGASVLRTFRQHFYDHYGVVIDQHHKVKNKFYHSKFVDSLQAHQFLPGLLQTRAPTMAPTPAIIPAPMASSPLELPAPRALCSTGDLCPAFRTKLLQHGVLRQPKAPNFVQIVTLHVVTAANETEPEYVTFARTMNRQFAEARGYGFTALTATLAADRHPSWSKVAAVREAFDNGAEYVLWVDSDAMVARDDFRVEAFAEQFEQDFIFSVDPPLWNCSMYCAGVWVARNTDWSRRFLDRWWDAVDSVQDGVLRNWHPYEQGVLQALVDAEDLSAHVAALPYCVLNSVCVPNQHGPRFQSPILHCMTLEKGEKLAFMTRYVSGLMAAKNTPQPTPPPTPPTPAPLACADCLADGGVIGTRRWCTCCMHDCGRRQECIVNGFLTTECLIGKYSKRDDEQSLDDILLRAAVKAECESCSGSFGFVGAAKWCRCCALDCGGHRQACQTQNGFCETRCTNETVCSHRSLLAAKAPSGATFGAPAGGLRERQEFVTAIGPNVVIAQATSDAIADEFGRRGAAVQRCCATTATVRDLVQMLAFADAFVGPSSGGALAFALFLRDGTIAHELHAHGGNSSRAIVELSRALNQTFIATPVVEPLTDVQIRAIVDKTMAAWFPR